MFDGSNDVGELRDCDAVATPVGWIAAVVSSDQKVLCFDGETNQLSWINDHAHTAPLSCVAIGGEYPNHIIASSGVDGQIRFWNASDGRDLGVSYVRENRVGMPVEIRSLRFLSDNVIVFGAADGFVGVLNYSTGSLVTESDLGIGVINALCVRRSGASIEVMVGASYGSVAVTEFDAASNVWRRADVIAQHLGSVNDVDFVQVDGVDHAVSASSDRTWRLSEFAELDAKHPPEAISGHYGSVWSITKVATQNGDMVVTGGSEGFCRIWMPSAVKEDSLIIEKGSRHVGPVKAIKISRTGDRDAVVFTGGMDGKVRRWRLTGTSTTRPLVQALSGVTALAINQTDQESRDEIVAATNYGAILYFQLRSGEYSVSRHWASVLTQLRRSSC